MAKTKNISREEKAKKALAKERLSYQDADTLVVIKKANNK